MIASRLRVLWAGSAALVLLAVAVAGARGEEAPAQGQPYALVRTLQHLQENIARGDVRAHEAQRALIDQITARLGAAQETVWREKRNVHAAVAFVLGGGPPSVLERLLDLDPPPAGDPALIRGALAYAMGREAEAREALAGIDPLTVAGHLGAQLAIVRSALAVREDPAEAARLLSIARLLAPGTLIEEAALRREIFVEGQRGDIERFEYLVIQYLRRFRHSVYAGNFRQRFILLLTQMDFARDVENFLRLEAILAQLDGPGERDLYLHFARHALLEGRIELARFAAARAAALSAGASEEEARAQFYDAAAAIVTPDFEPAAERLLSLDPAALPETDRPLLAAAMTSAIAIGDSVLAPPEDEDPPAQIAQTEPAPVIRRALAALAEIDALLEGRQ
ncbi:MAG: chemotaxis protein [Salinarimonadaceae bacterium]|nr:MAG: chemotaxis protein [Salinarimonadaceae bacterium]